MVILAVKLRGASSMLRVVGIFLTKVIGIESQ
jgi:hypothetical protein